MKYMQIDWQIFFNSKPKNTLLNVKIGKKVYFLVY